eukprot:m.131913 g.131913  ORF g.131913 m.131913 type:complete len:71 (+) comp38054_c0_seq11:733-945(+)
MHRQAIDVRHTAPQSSGQVTAPSDFACDTERISDGFGTVQEVGAFRLGLMKGKARSRSDFRSEGKMCVKP